MNFLFNIKVDKCVGSYNEKENNYFKEINYVYQIVLKILLLKVLIYYQRKIVQKMFHFIKVVNVIVY